MKVFYREDTPMKLYTSPTAPNPRRVAIVIEEKGLELPLVEVDLAGRENYTPDFIKINPLARVPVLVLDDGACLAESMSIIRYLESVYPTPALLGANPKEQALIDMWNRRMESEVMGPITGCFRHIHPYWEGRITQIKAWGELCLATLEERMQWLNDELTYRTYIAGEEFSVADITAVCAFDLGKVARISIPETLTHLRRWHVEVSARPSVAATHPSRRRSAS